MSNKFFVWLDSGANCDSCRETSVELSDVGLTNDEWDNLTEDEQDAVMREVAFEQSEWGYREIT
jgi:hypothetical protein